jgi:hypothetical protein
MTWKRLNAAGALAMALLWAIAIPLGWINSIALVSHVTMLTAVFTFVAAWRADVPTD